MHLKPVMSKPTSPKKLGAPPKSPERRLSKVISLKIPVSLANEITALADERMIPASHIYRAALREYLADHRTPAS